MNHFKYFLVIMIMCVCSACGTEGGDGGGNTVYLNASPKKSTSMSLFTHYTSATGTLSFTINSYPYSGGTAKSISPSKVKIINAQISYTPEVYNIGANLISPPLPAIQRNLTGQVDPGGTLDIDNMIIIEPKVVQTNLNSSSFMSGTLYYYTVNVRFNGYEIDTNQSVSCIATAPLYLQR